MAETLQILRALSEPLRLRCYLLLRQSPLAVSELAQILRISQSNASHHIKTLRELHLLLAEKNGQHTYYALNRQLLAEPHLAGVLRVLEEAATEIPERRSDTLRLRKVLSQRNAETFARWRQAQPDLAYSEAFAHLACGRRGRVLDIGCGEGDFFGELALSFNAIVAIDYDFAHARSAKDRGQNKAHVLCADAQELPLADACVDAIIFRMALSQIRDFVQALREALRALKVAGFLSIIDSDGENGAFYADVISALRKMPKARIDYEERLPRLFLLRVERIG
ncbi:MAG: metalloregulator ArsR/SmtB family transcription factor [Turneriella sp.]|nr:metalloregulator ArsR/SmtB family transcription factor [Turneriella sp.]